MLREDTQADFFIFELCAEMAVTKVTVREHTVSKHKSAVRGHKEVRAPKIRSSLKAGNVAILLAGRHAGKRVIVLKHLPSGFVVVAGCYGVNGVPVRRAHPKFMIGTSTAVDVSKVDVAKFDDAYFKSASAEAKKEDNKTLDKSLTESIKKTAHMDQYLKTRFSLHNTFGLKAHELKF